MKATVIYMSYDGMLEPLGQSQVIAYLRLLSDDFAIHLISFEKPDDSHDRIDVAQLRDDLCRSGITWHFLNYHKRPNILSTLYDTARGATLAFTLGCFHGVRVFHARSLLGAAMLLPVVALRRGSLIFDIRGFWVDEKSDGGIVHPGSAVERVLRSIERAVFHRADHIVTLTQCSMAKLLEDPRFGHPDAPVTVIPTCADLGLFKPGEVEAAGKPFVFGYVGQIGACYRFDEMIALFKAFSERKPDARMLVVNRSQQNEIRELLLGAGVSNDRFDIVAANRSEVPGHIRQMDVGVVLMIDAYSNSARAPTKVAEYLACGVPCVGDRQVGDLHEILDGELVGVTMRVHSLEERRRAVERILTLKEDPELAARCTSTARTYFSLEKGVDSYRAIYRSLADKLA